MAIIQVGQALCAANSFEDAIAVDRAALAYYEHVAPDYVDNIITLRGNISVSLGKLGRREEALSIKRECYQYLVDREGKKGERAIYQAFNIAADLNQLKRYTEATSFLRDQIPLATRVLGKDHEITLKFQKLYAMVVFGPPDGPWSEEKVRALGLLEAFNRSARRVLGPSHPETRHGEGLFKSMTTLLALSATRERE